MPTKHTIDPENQGSFLANTPELGPAPVAVGEGFYRPVLSPENQELATRIEAEKATLNWLDLEDRSRRNQPNNPAAFKETISGILLASKGSYARSQGIAIETARVPVTDDSGVEQTTRQGKAIDVRAIVAINDEEQKDLDVGYVSYRRHYAGTKNNLKRTERLAELEQATINLYTSAASGQVTTTPQITELAPSIGEPGSYVRLDERSQHLTQAILNFNQRAFRLGFDTASNVPEHEAPILERYQGSAIFDVQGGAARNAEKYLELARRKFWQATGYQAVRALNYEPRQATDARAREDWEEFHDLYGGRKSKDARDSLLNTVKPYLPADTQDKSEHEAAA